MINFPTLYPYATSLPEIWVRYLFAAVVYLLLGTASWLLLHQYIFNRSWKAFGASLLASAGLVLWPLTAIPYLRFLKLEFYLAVAAALAVPLAFLDLALWRKEGSIRLKERGRAKRTGAVLAGAALAVISIFAYIEYNSDNIGYRILASRLSAAEERLLEAQDEGAEKSDMLAQDPEFVALLKQEEFSAITARAQDVINESDLINGIAVTDRNGITVAAPHNPLLVGRNLTALGPSHVRVLEGSPSKTLEPAVTTPIVVGAGTPIKENGEVIGAVFAARLVDRDFLAEIKEDIGVAELVLHCRCNKIQISTIENQELDLAVRNFAKLAFTDDNLLENGSFTQNLGVNGLSYTVSGKFLTGEDGDPLAVLMAFEPYPNRELSIFLNATTILAAATAIALFFSPMVVHQILK